MEMRKILPAVAALIQSDDGNVLLQRRKDSNRWGLIGGHVEFGETVEEAMLREVFEETGCRSEVLRCIGVYSSPKSQQYEREDGIVQYVTLYFEVSLLNEPDLLFTCNETCELKFFEVTKLPDEMLKMDPNWIKDALNKEGTFFIR
ncbi:DNA mismatch repair protein MutT [Pararcticibacter amylolyticus]|uniref:DNA mismatch repair protein MutT n=2 Tax=Pararcticibacter amylolyticus TaxID=2173175 RepID=A0A2U2PJT6_9SPHI|nr:DNA mismatch repair protein MutT [Pararcticibacter amylolyticus]